MSSTTTAEWLLVLSRDGTVLRVADDAPVSWVGTQLEEREDAPRELKSAGQMILANARHAGYPAITTVLLPSVRAAAHLTVVDAMPLRRVLTDIRALLQSTLEVMQRQAKTYDVTLRITVDRQVPAVISMDADKIAWAIAALVGNALRYVHYGSQVMPGGSITVRATYDPGGREVAIETQDDGYGIPADKLRSLFTARLDQPRVGLGLWMVREVVVAHGGHMDIRSETDARRRGTTVRLTLPVQ